MFGAVVRRIFGTQNERELKKFEPFIAKANGFEEEISALSDDAIKAKAVSFRETLRGRREEIDPEIKEIRGAIAAATSEQERKKHKKKLREVKNGIMEDMIPEVFALVREASRRTIGLRHFDV